MGALNTALSEAPRLSPQETRGLLEDAVSESELLSHILENLLELSRSQALRLTLQLEPLTLEDVVQKTIQQAKGSSSMHQLVMDLPRTLPPLRADRIRLERILHNLVENAVKYSPGGEVRVSARQDGNNLVIAVHDQGPGISPEDQAKLFQPFLRIRQTETDGIKGIGLGLRASSPFFVRDNARTRLALIVAVVAASVSIWMLAPSDSEWFVLAFGPPAFFAVLFCRLSYEEIQGWVAIGLVKSGAMKVDQLLFGYVGDSESNT